MSRGTDLRRTGVPTKVISMIDYSYIYITATYRTWYLRRVKRGVGVTYEPMKSCSSKAGKVWDVCGHQISRDEDNWWIPQTQS